MGKISKIVVITAIFITIIAHITYAVSDADDYRPVYASNYSAFFSKAGTILGVVRSIGAVVSVIGIAVLGIKYMLGSIEERANYKETMLPFIIGIVILVNITGIVSIIQEIAQDETKVYCNGCGDELNTREQHNGKCSECGKGYV